MLSRLKERVWVTNKVAEEFVCGLPGAIEQRIADARTVARAYKKALIENPGEIKRDNSNNKYSVAVPNLIDDPEFKEAIQSQREAFAKINKRINSYIEEYSAEAKALGASISEALKHRVGQPYSRRVLFENWRAHDAASVTRSLRVFRCEQT